MSRAATTRVIGVALLVVGHIGLAANGAWSQSTTQTTGSTSTTERASAKSTSSTQPATPSTSIIQRAGGGGTPIPLRVAPVAVLDEPRSSPRLASLGVESGAYSDAVAEYGRSIDDYRAATGAVPRADSHIDAAIARQRTATDAFNAKVAEIADLLAAHDRLAGERTSAARRRDKGAEQLERLRSSMRELAINEYMAGGFGGAPEQMLDLDNATTIGSRRVLLGLVQRDRVKELEAVKAYHDDNERLAIERQAELDDVVLRTTAAEAARDQTVRDRDAAVADEQRGRDEKTSALKTVDERKSTIDERRSAIADARAAAVVPDIGLPFVVLNAYAMAADHMAAEQPSCHIRWTALAGIGRTESNHGTFGGATVDPDGNETKPIYGIPLDGSNGTANIDDTDGGALDGDAGTDRAAGPMQFIPSTWKTLGRDGNRDDKADPQNFYDAALSAANLLCRAGDLSSDDGMRQGFRRYNNDGNYVETVLERTHDYDRYQLPPSDGAPDPAANVAGLVVPGRPE